VSPTLETLEIYRLETGKWILVDTFEGDAVVRGEPFDAIEIPLATLWSR
jgi:hypothetical protein